jgi:hypothetical protein
VISASPTHGGYAGWVPAFDGRVRIL